MKELQKAYKEAVEEFNTNKEDDYLMGYMLGLKNAIAIVDSQWVSVEDRLPEDGRVIVFSPDYDIDDPFRIRMIESQFVKMLTDATHWMPLSDPPEKEKQS